MSANLSELIYDWNTIYARSMVPAGKVLLNDESLRDGLQSPSVRDPTIEEKIEILHLMEGVGINMLDIGLPGAGPRAVAHTEALAREIGRAKLKIKPNCAARTHQNDIRPIAEIVERTGVPIEAATFIGSSPIRRYTEDWTDDFLLRTTENAVKYAVSLGLDVMYVTEDTTRCDPETIQRLYSTAISCGAQGHRDLRHCGTCHADGRGGADALRDERSGEAVGRGHSRGVARPLRSRTGGGEFDCRAGRRSRSGSRYGCGIGERVGNTQMDQMLVNLKLLGIEPWKSQDLTKLKDYCEAVSKATGVPIPKNYPVVGDDAFRTGTGVHAAAVIKAYRKNDVMLANSIYSGVPSHFFGMEQVIEVGPMSGKSNVQFWLERHDIPATEELVDRIFQRAKESEPDADRRRDHGVRAGCKRSTSIRAALGRERLR